jgi:hypothetical protein
MNRQHDLKTIVETLIDCLKGLISSSLGENCKEESGESQGILF